MDHLAEFFVLVFEALYLARLPHQEQQQEERVVSVHGVVFSCLLLI